ncbi:Myc-type, basic helix-loop-helix [Sesbania bispinosa]|nr:Myc-type, basic helix-loop-helix [Sesbania bispinosa]
MDSNSRYQLQQNSGLLRFRSAPSSVPSSFKQGGEGGGAANNGNNQWEDFESERLVFRFMNSGEGNDNNNTDSSPSFREFVPCNNTKAANESSMSPLSRMNSQQGYSNHGASSSMMVGSIGMDHNHHKGFNSNLIRQNSVPAAGHFSSIISFQNGYDSMKGVGNYGGVNGSDDFQMGSEGIGTTRLISYDSWNGTSHLSDKQRERNDKLLSDAQNGELGNQVHALSHHLSLQRKSSEMFAMENFLQFPDSVPSNLRAKRGFATHPRSIAERVRRTRISERMRKLQELVPNIDKQTSTSDMLDLAVVYIKDLQKQFKTLSEKRAKCKCSCMQKSEKNQTT